MSFKQLFTKKLYRTCYFGLCLGILPLATVNLNAKDAESKSSESSKSSKNHEHENIHRLAVKLETNFWTLVKNKNKKNLKRVISPIFQGNGPFGTITRKSEIDTLLAANIEIFTLTDLYATGHHGILVTTYNFSYTGTGLTNGPTLSVWKEESCGWKLVSHSFSAEIPAAD